MPFLNEFHTNLLKGRNSKLLLFGPQQVEIDIEKLPEKIELYRSVESFTSKYLEETVFV
jgi:hypothetical protein